MKITYITNTISQAGGLQRVLLLKANYLAENMGYTISIIATNPNPADYLFYDISPLINHVTISPDKSTTIGYYKSYKKLLNNTINAINPDIVIMCDNGLKSFLLPFILNKKRILIYEMHVPKYINIKAAGLFKKIKNNVVYTFMNICAARFNKFIVVTKNGAKEWNLNNIKILQNPLWFVTDEISTLKNKKAIAVGRHSYEKGYDRMFAIWKQVTDKYPDWVLDVYGDDNPAYNIKQIAIDYGLASNVNFLPPTKDILSAYKNASIYVMTSRFEGFGMVLLEAMACGVPCIAYNCPVGPAQIINNNEDGFLIEDGNTAAFVTSLSALIENHELRSQMGAKAKISSQNYNIDVIMQQWDALFKSLL